MSLLPAFGRRKRSPGGDARKSAHNVNGGADRNLPLLEAEPVIRTFNVDSVTYRNLAQKLIQFKLDMIGNISFVPESEQNKKTRAHCGSWIVDREEGDEPFGVCCQGFENVPL
jgi:hypothetical protein